MSPRTSLMPQHKPSADKTMPTKHEGTLEPNYYCRGWNAKRLKYCRHRAGAGTQHPGVGRCKFHGGNKLVHGQRSRVLEFAPRIQELLTEHAANPDPLNVLPELALGRALLQDFIERYETFAVALCAWHDSWEGKYVPIRESEAKALFDVLDEYDAYLGEIGATPKQRADLESAKAAVAFLALPQEKKPRQLLDPTEAMRHIDTISKVIYRVEQTRQSGVISLDALKRFLFAVERVIESRVRDDDVREKIKADLLAIRV